MQQSTSIRFEFRDGIKDSHKHSALIQAGYDQMNLMVNLVGHITFADLFTQTFDELIPRIVPHVSRCAEYGLIGDPDSVVELLTRLQQHSGQDSFATLTERAGADDDAFSQETSDALRELGLCHGVYLPQVLRRPEVMRGLHEGILELIQYAGDFSYRSMWEVPMTKDLRTPMIAIKRAAERLLIFSCGYYSCCFGSTGVCQGGMPNDYCYYRPGQTICGTGSTPCSNHLSMTEFSDCGCC